MSCAVARPFERGKNLRVLRPLFREQNWSRPLPLSWLSPSSLSHPLIRSMSKQQTRIASGEAYIGSGSHQSEARTGDQTKDRAMISAQAKVDETKTEPTDHPKTE